MAYAKIILNGETLMDVTSDTVDSSNLLSGNTATKNSGAKVNGSIITRNEADMYELYSGNYYDVIIPSGYYSSNATLELSLNSSADVTFTSSTAFFSAPAGYYSTTATKTLTTQAAQAIYPSTTDQYVSSYRWLTGSQTIKSVTTSNLTAANIASGVTVKVGDANNASRISQVTGTYAPTTSSLTVTPTETSQTFNATGVYGYKPVTVNGISSTYVGTGITQRSAADLVVNGRNITTPAGYYSSGVSAEVSYMTGAVRRTWDLNGLQATVTDNLKFTNDGYVFSTTVYEGSYILPSLAAQTIYPSTADQTIASYKWLKGAQTIKSVTTTNLTASNIAEGVVVKVGDTSNTSRITQVTGTHKGGGGHDAVLLNGGIYDTRTPMYQNVRYNDISYYTNEDTFNFNEGDTISTFMYGVGSSNVYLNNTLIGSGMNVSFSAPSYPLAVYFSYGDGIYFNKAYPSGTLSITSNGTYSVYGYSSASVNVSGGGSGFTADEIAMRTISGDISGDATTIGVYAFANCSALTTISFPSATSIENYAFQGCSSLTTASFPSATSIGGSAFAYCYSLSTISFPSVTSIGGYAFYYCSALTTASFPSATTIGSQAFAFCPSLTTISFPNATSIGSSAFTACSSLTTASFPNVTSIGGFAFRYCSALTTISFPSVGSISSYAFYLCSKLTTVSFPNVTFIAPNTFAYCFALTTVSFPSATSIGASAFTYCSSLTTADFPNAIWIYSSAFTYCRDLTTASFPSASIISNYAFTSCYNLLSLYLLGSSIPTLGTNVFISTPIDGYTTSTGGVYGSIFVPSSLYDQYIVATNWSTYSARIVSV